MSADLPTTDELRMLSNHQLAAVLTDRLGDAIQPALLLLIERRDFLSVVGAIQQVLNDNLQGIDFMQEHLCQHGYGESDFVRDYRLKNREKVGDVLLRGVDPSGRSVQRTLFDRLLFLVNKVRSENLTDDERDEAHECTSALCRLIPEFENSSDPCAELNAELAAQAEKTGAPW